MKDQAHTLRSIFKKGVTASPTVLSVTSGKGGVGKTSIVINMAILLASKGNKVLVLDADLGLANVDVMLGLTPKLTIKDVLDGQCMLKDIVLKGPCGIKIIPASSGIQELSDLSAAQQINIIDSLDHFDDDLDFMLVDTGAGISKNVMYFNAASQRIVVVATPEPTSITDAYALIKVLCRQYGVKRFDLIVNNVTSKAEGDQVAEKLSLVCERFLGDVALDYLGSIPHDKTIPECIKAQKAFVSANGLSEATKRLSKIAEKVEETKNSTASGNLQFFFKKMLLNQSKGTSHAGYRLHGTY